MSEFSGFGFLFLIPLFIGYGVYWLMRRGYVMKALVERIDGLTVRDIHPSG